MDSSILTLWTCLFPLAGVPDYFANIVDPVQTPRSAASDLSLHGFPVSLLWGARYKWFKNFALFQYKTIFHWTSFSQNSAPENYQVTDMITLTKLSAFLSIISKK